MKPEGTPDDPEALRERLEALKGQLQARTPPAPAAGERAAGSDGGMGSAMSLGLRAGSEFISAVLVGAALGYGLDWLLHTKPLLTILFFLLGVVAGVFNVIRATSPKGARSERDSRLSAERADAKDVPRSRGGGKQED